jgi:glycosyltransferase involved in cell wall biosynthesis
MPEKAERTPGKWTFFWGASTEGFALSKAFACSMISPCFDPKFGKPVGTMVRVLVDTPALHSSHGSGIKTYALNLIRAQQLAGFEPHLLYDMPRYRDPVLGELYAGHFVRDRAPGRLRASWHAAKNRLGWASRLHPVVRRPEMIADLQELAEYRWIGNLPAWGGRQIYRLADEAFRRTRRFTLLDNPGGRFDLWHASFQRPLFLRGAKNIVTVHDLVPLRLPETNSEPKHRWYRLLREACKKADLVIAISHHTKRDLMEYLRVREEKIAVVCQAPSWMPSVPKRESERVLSLLGLEKGKYFLFVGNIEPRKNLRRLLQAHRRAEAGLPLVVAGHKAWLWEQELKGVAHLPGVRFLDYVPVLEKTVLYQNAAALLYPSLYEGFGLPPLEAMSAGVPVITSRNSSLPEVCGDAALYVDPYDVEDMASALVRMAGDSGLRASLAEKGKKQAARFTLERFSKQLREVYEGVLGSSAPRKRRSKTLAVVSLAIGPQWQKLAELSRPGFLAYARRIGAEYHEITEDQFTDRPECRHFNKLQLAGFLNRYERVLYVDADILISPAAPDLFHIVPETHVGACLERDFSGKDLVGIRERPLGGFPELGKAAFNAGVLVVSRAHRDLFAPPAQPLSHYARGKAFYSDQAYLNARLSALRLPFFGLDPLCHWTPGVAEAPGGRRVPPEAQMLHFCTEGFEYLRSGQDDLMTCKYHQMAAQLERWKGRQVWRFHPYRFSLDRGRIDGNSFPHRLESGEAAPGQRVCFGPYQPLSKGFYRLEIGPIFSGGGKSPEFRVVLCAERGRKFLQQAHVDGREESRILTLCLEEDIEDLEVVLYAGQVPYALECVRLEKLY